MTVNTGPFPAHAAANGAPYHHPSAWGTAFAPATLPELFARSAADHPDRVLVRFLGASWTYGRLYAEACRFAAGLIARGLGPGERVGLFLPNVPQYIPAYYGAMMAGCVAVNFSPLYSVDELRAQVADSGTRLLVTLDVPALLPTALEVLDGSALEQLVVCSLAEALPAAKGAALRLFKRGDLARVPARADVVRWSDFLLDAGWTDWLEGEGANAIADPDTLALLQYTGGTTGVPKGAMLSHANLAANARQVDGVDPFERDQPDVILGALPLFHVFANTCVLNRTVVRGSTIVMLPRFEPAQVLRAISKEQPHAFPGVPTMYQALLDHPACARTDFSSLRVCISGGAPLPAPLRERFEAATGTAIVEGYGLTESSGVVSVNPYAGPQVAGSIGQLLPGTSAILLDKEDPDRLAPDGEPGELAIAGPQVMRGYWNRPDTDGQAFARWQGQAWLRTGDIATIGPDGFVRIVDRSKDMIAVGGFKVFPSQVEAVLLEHADVKEALVIGVPDTYRGELPEAFVTLAEPDRVGTTGDALRDWLNARVGKHERVRAVTIRDSLPKTMIGKLDRKALRQEVLAGA